MELLRMEHVTICYDGEPVVQDVSLELGEGEILGIAGESGSGKSTLIKAIMGLVGAGGSVTGGNIWYKGENLTEMPAKKLRRLLGPEIGMVFQDCKSALCPVRKVGVQICEAVRAHEKLSGKEIKQRAVEIMNRIGLTDVERIWNSYPFELSGGMNQRVGICIAMLLKPALLLADEVTSALDVTVQKQVIEELLMMKKDYGTSMIVITHNIGVVRAMADRALILKDGRVRDYGDTDKVLRHSEDIYTRKLVDSGKLMAPVPGPKTAAKERILEARHLKKVYISGQKRITAVDDVSFELQRGECLGIVGESGSGKSTAAKMLTHLESITEGQIMLRGRDITHAGTREQREIYHIMQMVFQMPTESFDPRRTLGDGIGESLRNMGISRRETRKKVENLLQKCGLDAEYADRYPHQVSGGQCQRAAIARALAADPEILICDEATSALDVTVQKQILELLIELKETENLSFLFICHDLALVQAFCDRVIVMKDGKIVEEGNTKEIVSHPKSDHTKKLLESVL